MKLKKILTLMCCAVLLVCISVGATVAYLTSTADVTNTFTVGNVQIKLDEATAEYDKVKNEWVDNGKRTEDGQSYKLLPGVKIDKDPTVTVVADSEECYVRALVTVSYNAEAESFIPTDFFTKWIKGYDASTWVANGVDTVKTTDEDGVTTISRTYELRYNETVKNNAADQKLTAIFTDIELPGTLTNDQIADLNGLEIKVVAHAIQADGFANAAAAWGAWSN